MLSKTRLVLKHYKILLKYILSKSLASFFSSKTSLFFDNTPRVPAQLKSLVFEQVVKDPIAPNDHQIALVDRDLHPGRPGKGGTFGVAFFVS